MELILATRDGREIETVPYNIDMEAGGTNTFELSIPRAAWTGDYEHGMLLYVPYTEFGGIIGEIETLTDPEMVYCKGYIWRGSLEKKIIEPPPGQDYYTVSGDINACIRQLITNIYADPLMRGTEENAGVSVSGYRFDRYTDLLSGIEKMLKSVGYRIDLSYKQEGTGGYVEVGSAQIRNYTAQIELSEDDELKITADDIRNGTNHLICLGQGELAERTVIHLYADEDGNISTTQTFFGRDEITSVFDYSSAEDAAELIRAGLERFEELKSSKRFDAEAGRIEANLQIGDIISGRDYTTGINVVRPIERKIFKIVNEIETIEYRLEGEG